MVFSSQVKTDFDKIISYGDVVRFRYLAETFSPGSYDDNLVLVKSGVDVYSSGLLLPLDVVKGSSDSVLLEQGRVKQHDQKLYVPADIATNGTVKIGIGSPVVDEYFIVPKGVITWAINGVDIYKKVYIRQLTNGSIYGE